MHSHLANHKLLDSAGFSEVKAAVSRCLWPHRMNLSAGESLHPELYGVFFGSCALFELCYGARVEIDAGDIESFYLVRITLQGHGQVRQGGRSVTLQPGMLTISSPSQHSYIRTERDCRSLILRVARDALERQLQQLLQRPMHQPLVFEMCVQAGHPGLAVISHTLDYIGRLCADCEPAQLLPPLGDALADYLISVLLTQLPHNYSDEVRGEPRGPVPYYVKRVCAHVEEHLEQNLSLLELAQVGGVSVRTLQNGFTRFVRQSPSEYLRTRRLARIHEALQRACDGDSVTDILLRHGISSLGHFATQYRKRYGCLPSETLRQG
ncbi:AraC family transcriptional regulator [Stutzerimonas azotifigens]|uniref:AraC family transcriptional regulator n=1 Tax=Stutzerimonas azotifigens TaxID=291995 RepID=UPI0004236342|nr:AraC family transcriptional regulator [Stutzerimonas azotifigens]